MDIVIKGKVLRSRRSVDVHKPVADLAPFWIESGWGVRVGECEDDVVWPVGSCNGVVGVVVSVVVGVDRGGRIVKRM